MRLERRRSVSPKNVYKALGLAHLFEIVKILASSIVNCMRDNEVSYLLLTLWSSLCRDF